MALSSLQLRMATAAVIAPVFIGVMLVGGWLFSAFVTITTLIGMNEYFDLIRHYKTNPRQHMLLGICGIAALLATASSLVYLRRTAWPAPALPTWLPLLMLMAAVWATDICAYFTGRALRGPKLAPAISPNKTWSGLGGGVVGAMAALGGLAYMYGFQAFYMFAAFGAALALVAQAGDLIESWLKRRAGVEDSGTLLPGHGGVLDRIDGLIFTAPLFVLFMWAVA